MFGINNKEEFLNKKTILTLKNEEEVKKVLKLLEDNFKNVLWCNGYKPTRIKNINSENRYLTIKNQILYASNTYNAENGMLLLNFYEFDSLIAWFNKPILNEKERKYLSAVIKPFRHRVQYIYKANVETHFEKINIVIKSINGRPEYILLPLFAKYAMYRNMKTYRKYTLEELGLIKPKQITLKAFFESGRALAIHCDTEEKANKLLNAFDKLGKKLASGNSYLFDNLYRVYSQNTCYTNDGQYCSYEWYNDHDYTIYEFDEVDLEN